MDPRQNWQKDGNERNSFITDTSSVTSAPQTEQLGYWYHWYPSTEHQWYQLSEVKDTKRQHPPSHSLFSSTFSCPAREAEVSIANMEKFHAADLQQSTIKKNKKKKTSILCRMTNKWTLTNSSSLQQVIRGNKHQQRDRQASCQQANTFSKSAPQR